MHMTNHNMSMLEHKQGKKDKNLRKIIHAWENDSLITLSKHKKAVQHAEMLQH